MSEELVTPKGRPAISKTDDGRKRVTRRYDVRSDAADPATIDTKVFLAYGTADPKYTGCVLVDHYLSASADDGAKQVLTRIFEEIGDTPVQLGNVECRMADSRAFVDTDGDGKIDTGTRFAREWSIRYIVKGDGTISDGHWLAVNTSKTFGARTGYFTGGSIIRKGVVYSVIARVYNEIPDRYTYPRTEKYTFPGTLGVNNGVPYGDPAVTRYTTVEIEETYHLGEVSGLAAEWEVLRWASGTVNFTSDGKDGSKAFTFPGCIGELTITANDVYFAGYLCDVLAGVIDSNPSSYPTGKKRISSDPEQWRGDIWIRRNVYVTFP